MQSTHRPTQLGLLLAAGLLTIGVILFAMQITRTNYLASATSSSPTTTQPTTGITYYVAPTGNDRNTGISINTPWRTLAKVNRSSFRPGDQILLQRGSLWRETLLVPSSGVAGQPITIDAYGSGDAPVIDGADQAGRPVRKIGIQLTNRQYVVIQNLTIQNASSRNIQITNKGTDGYNELRHLTVRNAVYPGIDLTDTGHNLIDSCEIAGNGREGILVDFTRDMPGLGFNTFSNNQIHDNVMPGINLIGSGSAQRTVHNSIHDNVIYGNGDGVYLHYADYTDVAHNTIHENNNQGYKGEGTGISHMTASYNDAHDNVIYGQRRSGIEYWGGKPHDGHDYGRTDGNRAYRNHIYNNARDDGAGIFLSSAYSNDTVLAYNLIEHNGSDHNNVSYGILLPNAPDTGSMILNNTIVANVRGQLRVKGAQTIVRNNVLGDPDYVVYSDGSYTVTGDLKFVDPDQGDFKLQSSASGIVSGVDLSDLPADILAIVNQDITGALIQGKRAIGACGFEARKG